MMKKSNKIIRVKGLQSSFDDAGDTADKTAIREAHKSFIAGVTP
jgi:hypothetical protein